MRKATAGEALAAACAGWHFSGWIRWNAQTMEHTDVEHLAAERAGGERAAPVIYEVNLDVDAALAAEYRAWLREHVAQMLALPGFVSARTFEVVDPPAPGRLCLCVHYRLRDAAALQAYFEQHAARMRGDGAARFGDRVRASRRVLRCADGE